MRQPISRTVGQVMAVAGQLDRLPEWAYGFAQSAERVVVGSGDDDDRVHRERWVVESPFGHIEVEFFVDVASGILDHDVTMPDGTVVHNRLRVEPAPHGSDVLFTLVRLPGMTDDQWRDDERAVTADLRRLAELCEKIDE
ncbi:MAG: SRPBCC family protein [Microcella sp.]|nr:MAG: SRPBCC family protein [Microcella sp.]